MHIRNAVALLCLSLVAISAWSEETRTWVQTSENDFAKGTAKGLSIRNDGKLELAPRLEQIDETPASYFWDLVAARDGTIYAAAGPEATVIRIAPDGQRSVFFETDAIEIHALALDAAGNLYAAAAPSSQVYRISPSGEAAVFYDPQTPYVWDMAFGPDGALYLATGDRGAVHRVAPDGTGAVFFETGDVHVRSLAFDAEGRLVIGTDPSGLILRIDASGSEPRGFVLHQTERKEVTAIAVGADGSIYAAGVGLRSIVGAPSPAPQQATVGDGQSNDNANQSTSANEAAQAARQAPSVIALQVRGGSSVVRITVDGEPQTIWESSEAIAYSLGFDASGRLLVGTGDNGQVYRVDSAQDSRLLTTLDSNQITAIAAGPNDSVLLGASNIGKIFRLGPGLEAEGTFESDVLDAEIFSKWGALESEGEMSGGEIELSLRSGNVDRPTTNWSDWSAADGSVPAAEFAQFRAVLRAAASGPSPLLEAVTLYYRPVNRRPRIIGLEITPPNYRFPEQRPVSRPDTLSLPPIGTPPRRAVQQTQLNQTLVKDPGWMSVRWQAEDPNADSLRAQIEIRGESDPNWVVLGKDIQESEFSWDSTALPDGRYRIRLTVNDADSNPAGESLSASRETELFVIDNAAPVISDLSASVEADRVRIRFQAQDLASKLTRAEYSVNGGEWAPADPQSGLFDAGLLDFDFEVDAPTETGGIVVAVRAYDERDNVAAGRVVVR